MSIRKEKVIREYEKKKSWDYKSMRNNFWEKERYEREWRANYGKKLTIERDEREKKLLKIRKFYRKFYTLFNLDGKQFLFGNIKKGIEITLFLL